MSNLDELVRSLVTRRWRVSSEGELQDAVAETLAASFPADIIQREVVLTNDVGKDVGRIDFLVGTTGLELKIKGSRAGILRQCQGYLTSPLVADLLVASTMSSVLRAFPSTLAGKPFRSAHLRSYP